MTPLYQLLTDEQQEVYDGIMMLYTAHDPVPAEVFCADCPNHPMYQDGGDNPKAGTGICHCSLNPYRLAVD